MKKLIKTLSLFLICVVTLVSLPSVSFAATVGQSLTNPESGWQRIDDTDAKIKYTGAWITNSNTDYSSKFWNNSQYYTNESTATIQFKFYGTNLRVIGNHYNNKCKDNIIIVDGVEDTFSAYTSNSGATYRGLMYEKTGLDKKVHTVVIKPSPSMETSQNLSFDAIDIDDDGYLIDPEAPESSSLKVVAEVGENIQLSVNDNLSQNTKMTWTSSNSEIASVDSQGAVTGVAPGDAVITVTNADGTYKETINILVIESEPELAVDLKVGDTRRLTVDDLSDTVNATWDSSYTNVATVDSKGRVTAVGQGTTYITVKDEQNSEIGKILIRVQE